MTLINGTIGCVIFKFNKTKIIIFSDSHDGTVNCGKNQEYISVVLNKYIGKKDFVLLLEEPPRDNSELEELWKNSIHTQKLKKLYLENPQVIEGIDIRFKFIPFSWETDSPLKSSVTLGEYLYEFNNFFTFTHGYTKLRLGNLYKKTKSNTQLYKIYNELYNKYTSIISQNKHLMNMTINQICTHDINIMESINRLNDKIMEFYTVLQIINNMLNGKKSIVIHAGLFHTSSITEMLTKHLNLKIYYSNGITNRKNPDINHKSCLSMDLSII